MNSLLSSIRQRTARLWWIGVVVMVVMSNACSSTGSGESGKATPSSTSGADRASNSSSLSTRSDLAGVKVGLDLVARLENPVTALAPRFGSANLYVTDQSGRVIELVAAEDGRFSVNQTPVIDLSSEVASGGERGLLGLVFSPEGDKLYTFYTALDGALTVDEFRMDGSIATPSSRRNLLSLTHPRPNHNGGQLTFAADGYLYIGTGDGGGAGDPDHNGQNLHTLLAKILRIDPRTPTDTKPYGIPEGNPFADGTNGAPEVWAYGLRNPWRFSFDRTTGDLWIGDVGQNAVEEIDYAPNTPNGSGPANNYGWSQMEGSQPFQGGTPPAGYVPPIHEYHRDSGECSVVGGYVARTGDALLDGIYLFGDYCTSRIDGLVQVDGKVTDVGPIGPALDPGTLSSFGQDNDGHLYVVQLDGRISRLVPRTG